MVEEEEEGQNAGACLVSENRRVDSGSLSKPACVITADLTSLREWAVNPLDLFIKVLSSLIYNIQSEFESF